MPLASLNITHRSVACPEPHICFANTQTLLQIKSRDQTKASETWPRHLSSSMSLPVFFLNYFSAFSQTKKNAMCVLHTEDINVLEFKFFCIKPFSLFRHVASWAQSLFFKSALLETFVFSFKIESKLTLPLMNTTWYLWLIQHLWALYVAMLNGIKSTSTFSLCGACRIKYMCGKFR